MDGPPGDSNNNTAAAATALPTAPAQHVAALAASASEPADSLAGIPADVLAAAQAAQHQEDLEPIPVRPVPAATAPGSSDDEGSSSEEEEGVPAPAAAPSTDAIPPPPRTVHERPAAKYADPEAVSVEGGVTLSHAGTVLFCQPAQGSVVVQHPGSGAQPPPGAPSGVALAPSGGLAHGAAPLTGVLAQVAAGVLEEGSLLALPPPSPSAPPLLIGRIDEVFGPVGQPCYLVRLTADQCKALQEGGEEEEGGEVPPAAPARAHISALVKGTDVVSVGEYSALVNPALCRSAKPSDASNLYDEEASDDDYSDDEAEAAAKKGKRRAARGGGDMAAAAAAADGEATGKRRRRTSRRRGTRGGTGGGPAPVVPPGPNNMTATIAAQQAQIAALQAHLASMQAAMGPPAPMMGMPYGIPVQGMFPQSVPAPAQAHVPSPAAMQFMAAAARAAAGMNSQPPPPPQQ